MNSKQFWNWIALSDREKLRWAIMTEDAVKNQPYSKAARASAESYEEEEEPDQVTMSKTSPVYRKALNDNDLLFNVYPDKKSTVVSDVLLSRLEKDKLLFQCKRHTIFDMPFRNDGTLDANGRNSNVGGSESNDLGPSNKISLLSNI